MKSKTTKTPVAEKGFFRKAGEVIGKVGHELAEGKDKVVAASQNLIGNIAGKESPAKRRSPRKAAKKVAAKKSPGAIMKKVVKKAVTKKIASKTGKAVASKHKD